MLTMSTAESQNKASSFLTYCFLETTCSSVACDLLKDLNAYKSLFQESFQMICRGLFGGALVCSMQDIWRSCSGLVCMNPDYFAWILRLLHHLPSSSTNKVASNALLNIPLSAVPHTVLVGCTRHRHRSLFNQHMRGDRPSWVRSSTMAAACGS